MQVTYVASEDRYEGMKYNRVGRSGLKLPAISLGLWHNFGGVDTYENGRNMITRSFDLGITHFDLANNYGPPAGSAEETFGKVLSRDLKAYRDEIVVSSKAGYYMWPGPYGDFGSRKYLVSSLDQSLKRMGLTMWIFSIIIGWIRKRRSRKPWQRWIISFVPARRCMSESPIIRRRDPEAISILKSLGTPLLIHQPSYSMLDRWVENGLLDVLEENGVGSIAFTPLAQGLLTNKYLNGVPVDSRAASASVFLNESNITPEVLRKIRALNQIAQARNQSLAQFALAWVLRGGKVTSALIGASKVSQIEDNVAALNNLEFSKEELDRIEAILKTENASPSEG